MLPKCIVLNQIWFVYKDLTWQLNKRLIIFATKYLNKRLINYGGS
jgi:hypothetical protein